MVPIASRVDQQKLEELLQQIQVDYGVPALAAAIVLDGEIVAAATGVRRIDRTEPVTVDDKFHIGSVSKPITATVIATLVEANVLDWQTSVATAFPDLAGSINAAYRTVTLQQLLSHRAGIVPWEEDEEIARAPVVSGTPTQQRRESLLWLLGQEPVAAPGSAEIYSNAGYMVAAAMAEQLTGTAWEDLVLERLARPLGLTSLGFGWPAHDGALQPWGHFASPGGFTPHDPDDEYQAGPRLVPAGDIHMTISDLARFAELHLEGLQGKSDFLALRTFRTLHEPIGDYALGWNVRETADHHLGGLGTFLAAIWVSVPRNTAVVVATNADADEAIVSAVINGTLKAFDIPKP